MKIEDVEIMKWGKNSNDLLFLENQTELPDETIVTIDFDKDNVVGVADNFQKTDEGVTCDIKINDNETIEEIENGIQLTAGPTVTGKTEGKEFMSARIQDISIFGNNHANNDLTGNLNES